MDLVFFVILIADVYFEIFVFIVFINFLKLFFCYSRSKKLKLNFAMLFPILVRVSTSAASGGKTAISSRTTKTG